MPTSPFDPNANKVHNFYGGYDPNEKGITQYPRKPTDNFDSSSKRVRPSTSYPPSTEYFDQEYGPSSTGAVFNNRILDSVSRHYRLFIQDPDHKKHEIDASPRKKSNDSFNLITSREDDSLKSMEPMSCGIQKLERDEDKSVVHLIKKPINPVHWKPDLFDTKHEKYYLKNNLIENPYRDYLKASAVATTPPHYFTEYKASFSGNPTKTASSSGRIIGLSRPTDITETCDWRRNRTQRLRDVVFTHKKDPIDSHLDYNDPKRYNPWPRLKMSYDLMLEGNYRPRPSSGVEYKVTTLLPAVSPYSKRWVI